MKTETKIEYRLMVRRPGAKRFSVTDRMGSLQAALRRADWLNGLYASEGWEYKVEQRTLTIASTPWRPAK